MFCGKVPCGKRQLPSILVVYNIVTHFAKSAYLDSLDLNNGRSYILFYHTTIMKFATFLLVLLNSANVSNAFIGYNSPLSSTKSSYHNYDNGSSISSSSSSLYAQQQTSYYAAAGSPSVNMDQYNIPLSQSINEWTAVIQAPSSMQDEGIFLRAKNTNKDLFVDTLQYTIKRTGGLGLMLTEIAGGREDGVGITIIEEVLAGGNADNCGIVPGDSIVALTVKNTNNDDELNVQELRTDVSTECLGYDATIDAIMSLPPCMSEDDEVTLTVKRIRKQPKINVKLQYPPYLDEPDVTIELFAGENLRRAMVSVKREREREI